MPITTEKVSIEDVYPDDNNPRRDFGDLEALASGFAINADRPGEPFTPPLLVRDGGIYRIVDGERRYRAMRLAKTKSFTATVADTMDEANVMVAMLATDDKQPLTDIERSRGVQQALALGVDPVPVAKAARIKSADVHKVATAMAKVDDAAGDMTLDRLYAIADFADDPDAVEQLTNCKENEWTWVCSTIKRQREDDIKAQELKDALETSGIPIVDDVPDGYCYKALCRSVEDVAELDAEEFLLAKAQLCNEYLLIAKIYIPASDAVVDTAKEERMQLCAEIGAILSDGKASRAKWLANRIADGVETIPTLAEIFKRIMNNADNDDYYSPGGRIKEFEKLTGESVKRELNATLIACLYEDAERELNRCEHYLVYADMSDIITERVKNYLTWIDAFVADGYEETPGDIKVRSLCNDLLDAKTQQSSEVDDGE
ncbi:MAG: ParB/RepB/Spo0J family partition protein [Gordonibacter sp.]|uniref:ParB/RepB/Spo0J family partition protein n=1 Tax=Gordonibacter sp. TaxID=1968902 RepID=UPI002FC7AD0F